MAVHVGYYSARVDTETEVGVLAVWPTDLHGCDVSLHASLVVGDARDRDVELVDANTGVVQLVVGVLASALRLQTRATLINS